MMAVSFPAFMLWLPKDGIFLVEARLRRSMGLCFEIIPGKAKAERLSDTAEGRKVAQWPSNELVDQKRCRSLSVLEGVGD